MRISTNSGCIWLTRDLRIWLRSTAAGTGALSTLSMAMCIPSKTTYHPLSARLRASTGRFAPIVRAARCHRVDLVADDIIDIGPAADEMHLSSMGGMVGHKAWEKPTISATQPRYAIGKHRSRFEGARSRPPPASGHQGEFSKKPERRLNEIGSNHL